MRCVFILFLLTPYLFQAQDYEVIDVIDKIGQNSVLAILQDEAGFIWLGTIDGLYRYDGSNVMTFRYQQNDENCICGNQVLDIVNDHNGSLWIATRSCLNKLNLNDYSFTHYFHDESNDNSISENHNSRLEFINDNLYVLTEKGLDVYNPEKDVFSNFRLPNSSERSFFHKIDSTQLLISTPSDIFVFNALNETFNLIEDLYDISYEHKNIDQAFVRNQELFITYPCLLYTSDAADE